jgi:hypothetical protein
MKLVKKSMRQSLQEIDSIMAYNITFKCRNMSRKLLARTQKRIFYRRHSDGYLPLRIVTCRNHYWRSSFDPCLINSTLLFHFNVNQTHFLTCTGQVDWMGLMYSQLTWKQRHTHNVRLGVLKEVPIAVFWHVVTYNSVDPLLPPFRDVKSKPEVKRNGTDKGT